VFVLFVPVERKCGYKALKSMGSVLFELLLGGAGPR